MFAFSCFPPWPGSIQELSQEYLSSKDLHSRNLLDLFPMTKQIDFQTPYFRRHNIGITHLLGKNGNSSVEISDLLEIFFCRDGCRFCHRLQVVLIIKLTALPILRIIAQTDPVYRNIESSFADFSTLWSVHPRKSKHVQRNARAFPFSTSYPQTETEVSDAFYRSRSVLDLHKRCRPIFSQSLEMGKRG